MAFSPNGTRCLPQHRPRPGSLTRSPGRYSPAWSTASGVHAVAFSPDGTRVATGSDDGSARVFDAVTGAEWARLDHGGPVCAVAFSPDGTRVATGSEDNLARVFDLVAGAS